MTRRISPWLVTLLIASAADLAYTQPPIGSVSSTPAKPATSLPPEPETQDQAKIIPRVPPGVCKLQGKVEGDYASVQAHFIFETTAPSNWVILGLQGAYLTDEGKLDNELPLLRVTEGGIEVRVDKPSREHNLLLNFRVPIKIRRGGAATSNSERTLEFGLPGAAVTLLALELPPGVKELRANDNLETRPRQAAPWQLALGPVDKLKLSWKEPAAGAGKENRTCDSTITVVVDEAQIETNAVLILEDLGGQTKDWQFLFPAQVEEIKVKTASGVPPEIIDPDDKNPFHTLRFADPSRERFEVHVREARALDEVNMTVGPFCLVGASRQAGVVTVKKAPTVLQGKRLEFQRRPHVFGKSPANSADIVAEFQYSKLPQPNRSVPSAKLRTDLALLDFSVKPDRGQYETHVEHHVHLQPSVDAWLVTTTSKVRVKSQVGQVGFVDVRLPIGEPAHGLALLPSAPAAFPAGLAWLPMYCGSLRYWPMAAPAEFSCEQVDGPRPTRTTNEQHTRITLTGPPAREFTVVLTGEYLLPRDAKAARLQLPAPAASVDRGARISVTIDHRFELQNAESKLADTSTRHQHTWEQVRAPEQIDVAWRPYVPDFLVVGTVNVTLHDGHARIRQEMSFPDGVSLPAGQTQRSAISFTVPDEIKGLPRVFYGYDPDTRTAFAMPSVDDALAFEFSVSLPREARQQPLTIPLLWPAKATMLEAKVRVWTPPGTLPRLDERLPFVQIWDNTVTEFVAGKDALPGLVLRGVGSKLPLSLRLEEPPEAKVPDIVFERGLIEIELKPDGGQSYRVRFVAKRVHANTLEVAIPGLSADGVQSIQLDDIELAWGFVNQDAVRVQIKPELVSGPAVLEIKYSLRQPSTNGWHTLRPPRIRSAVFLNGIRWQVLGPDKTALFLLGDDAQVDYQWVLSNGWLPTPLPSADRAELESWLLGPDAVAVPGYASLLFWRSSLETINLWQVPDRFLFAVCSALFLLVGLGLSFVSLSRYTFWLVVVLLALMLLAAGMLWPAVLPVVLYGSQPGLVILVLLLAVQWLLHERYRRQLLFLPGFTRRKANSSIVRGAAAVPQARREASTVDAPAGQATSGVGSHGT